MLNKQKSRKRNPLKKVLFLCLLPIIWLNDYFLTRHGRYILSVLCYHRINDVNNDDMTVSTKVFEHQVQLLKKNYHVISANELYGLLDNGPRPKHKKNVLITFDDGYEDNFKNAFPILKKHACPAIFFVPTSYVGTAKSFIWDSNNHPGLTFPKMSWEQLKEASQNNIEIGVHSHTHIDFKIAEFTQVIHDIEISLKTFKQYFNQDKILLAYPFGGKINITDKVRSHIKQHEEIVALFSAYGGRNISPINRYDIRRMFISSEDKGIILRYRITGGLSFLLSKWGLFSEKQPSQQE